MAERDAGADRQVTGLVSKLDGRFERPTAEVDSVESARDIPTVAEFAPFW